MNGYGSHTFFWENAGGEKFRVKYHFKTDQGIECPTDAEAEAMAAEDPDHHLRDLYGSIAGGRAPLWTVKVQVMPFHDAADYRLNPFDLTKVWPHGDHPLQEIGRLVLDRDPESYFTEVEQAAFGPSNMVLGIGPSPDKMLLGRMSSYPDTHRYRIGTNYLELPTNHPRIPVHSYTTGGSRAFTSAFDPVYAPSSTGGPAADATFGEPSWGVAGESARAAYTLRRDDDFTQAGSLVWDVLDEPAHRRLVAAFSCHLRDGRAGGGPRSCPAILGPGRQRSRRPGGRGGARRWVTQAG